MRGIRTVQSISKAHIAQTSCNFHAHYKNLKPSISQEKKPLKPATEDVVEPEPVAKRKPPRPYFARLDPRNDLNRQIASRIVQYISAESDEVGRVRYMRMYHSLHGNRYRNVRGRDLWAEALKYLGRSVCRKPGLIWLNEKRVVPDLPSPYKPLPKLIPRKRKPRTAWYKDVALRAEQNGLSISEQVEADRQGRSRFQQKQQLRRRHGPGALPH